MQYRTLLFTALVFSVPAFAAPSLSRAEDRVETKSQAVQPQDGIQSSPPLTPEQSALLAIQEDGQRQVAQIVQTMQGVTSGPSFEALQAQIVQVKMDTYIRFLTATAGFARARGDEAAALEAERIIEQVRNPQQPQEPTAPQHPEKAPVQDGGKR